MRRKEEEIGKTRPISAQIAFGQGRCAEGEKPAQPSPKHPTAARLWQEKAGEKTPAFFWDVFKLFISGLDEGIEGILVAQYKLFHSYIYIQQTNKLMFFGSKSYNSR